MAYFALGVWKGYTGLILGAYEHNNSLALYLSMILFDAAVRSFKGN
jgi:hypothetical protein